MGYAPPGTNPLELVSLAQEAERLGYASAWAAEARGTDAATALRWVAATAAPLPRDVRIWLAASGPKNVELAAEIADGWMPIFFDPERAPDVFGPHLAGARDGFEIAPTVNVLVGDDVPALRDALKPHLALYVGGMGAKGKNFYNALMRRYGWEAEAERIQELYLGGRHRDAIAAVPDELVDAVALVGPKERIADRLAAWRETAVTTLIVGSPPPEALEVMAGLVL